MKTIIAGIEWKNPLTTASGTYNYDACKDYYEPSALGAVTTKGVSAEAWAGNPLPRIAETPAGMLNSIGLENPGAEDYISPGGELAKLKAAGAVVIANVCGHTPDEYLSCVGILDSSDVDMLELNVSCPNVDAGGMAIGTDPAKIYELTGKVKDITKKPVAVKLTPNVTDIAEAVRAAQDGGADALSLINTLVGMRIDIKTRRPVLSKGAGGLSGPAIFPVALAAVSRARAAAGEQLPIIGMGGIASGADAYEMLLAGATAVAVGTAALIDPHAPLRILDELADLFYRLGDPRATS